MKGKEKSVCWNKSQQLPEEIANLHADRHFGQAQTTIQVGREKRDLRLSQTQQNVSTLTHRAFDSLDHATSGLSRLGGEGAPLPPALGDAVRIVTGAGRSAADLAINNTNTEARIGSVKSAGQGSVENYEFTARLREYAADAYAEKATQISNEQAAANNAAARVQRDLATGGVETAYRQQVQGVAQA